MSCISDHSLQLMAFNDSEESCLGCGIGAIEITRRYQCIEGCEGEYCGHCVDNMSIATSTVSTNPKCKGGHRLILTNSKGKWSCASRKEPGGCKCGSGRYHSVRSQLHFECTSGCDLEYCGPCYDNKVQKIGSFLTTSKPDASDVRINSAGVLSRPSFDFRHSKRVLHYCGRNVGQQGYLLPCNECDGRCGPDTGCQCASCFELDSENFETPDQSKNCCNPNCTVRCPLGHTLTFSRPQIKTKYCVRGVCAGQFELAGYCRVSRLHEEIHGDSSHDRIQRGHASGGRRRNHSNRSISKALDDRLQYGPMWRCSGGCNFEYCTACYDMHQVNLWQNSDCNNLDLYKGGGDESKGELKHISLSKSNLGGEQSIFPECAVCFENRPLTTMVHGSSGHTICCRSCAVDLMKNKHPCPICRQLVEALIDVYV